MFDRRNDSRPYPNLAPMMDNPHDTYHGMGDTYPHIVPCRLLLYCYDHKFPMNISYTDEPLPANAIYPVGLGFFNFGLDYFGLMSEQILNYCHEGKITVLFYYHEGDNPYYEKKRLDELCEQHNLPVSCYRFISGNTEADKIPGFIYFPDHELFYWRNGVVWNDRLQPGAEAHTKPRGHTFTMLSRFHKWWRATITAYFHREGLLENSLWSYNNVDMGDKFNDNPIQLSRLNLENYLTEFLDKAPYTCDELTTTEHNQHWMLARHLYEDSYCSFVLETLYDAEQSGGAFITEKTFKSIRNGHPFVVFGCPNSLAVLRRLGYRTFDNAIDTSYDTERNNTQRFIKTIDSVKKLLDQDLHTWYLSCLDDIKYNQDLFVGSKYNRLEELNSKL